MLGVLNLVTYNVKGLQQKVKRQKKFKYVSEHLKEGIAFFQETHSTTECVKIWEKEWAGDIFVNHGESNNRGVALAFSPNLTYKKAEDDEGRLQIMSIEIKNTNKIIVNIYNDNVEYKQVALLKKLDSLLNSFEDLFNHDFLFVDHDFLLSALKNFGFGPNFISWVKILLNSCVMNGVFSTGFFNL